MAGVVAAAELTCRSLRPHLNLEQPTDTGHYKRSVGYGRDANDGDPGNLDRQGDVGCERPGEQEAGVWTSSSSAPQAGTRTVAS